MKARAAVAYRAGVPLVVETVDLEGPRAGEVLAEIRATQGQGVMPDGTSRFAIGGQKIHHYRG